MMLSTQSRLKEAMHEAAERMERRGDGAAADKLRELADKLESEALEVAFCGHFSAGKSTLVNRLCGAELLPSSPIPTSANIVTIRYGDRAEAVIRYRNGAIDSVAIDALEAHAKNGGEIEEITIRYPWTNLAPNLVLMDTPGIDSTDEAHQLATASVMHRADVVFYVMDYNHVQSEINFTFAKKLADRGKPVYLIVNQIDKHRDRELSFRQYRASVEDAFDVWGLTPAGFFFLSLKAEDHPHNEWPDFVRFLRRLPEYAETLKPHNAFRSALALADDHGKWLEQEQAADRAELERQLATADIEGLLARRTALGEQAARLRELPDRQFAEAKLELERMIDNANITPAMTRDLAAAVLESRQPGFKTGFLRAAAKTEAERERRLSAFLADFREQVAVHLYAHFVRLLEQTAAKLDLDIAAYDERMRSSVPPISADDVIALIPPGVGATGEAVLNYTQRVAAEAKRQYRRAGMELLAELTDACREKLAPALRDLERQLADLERELAVYERLRRMDDEAAAYVQSLASLIEDCGADGSRAFPAPERTARDAEAAPDETASPGTGMATAEAAPPPSQRATAETSGWKGELEAGLRRTAEQLREAVRLVADIPALQSTARSIQDKADRLSESRYSLALFGAFSAGKSSFANALLGARAMPVSPNPTTAAIIRVVPPEGDWTHGTAKVKLKRREALEEEVLYSLEQLGLQAGRLEDGLALAAKVSPGEVGPKGRPHFAFLRAVKEGWEREQAHLGQELRTDMALYGEYAAVEARSCFVDEIELHLSCPMTDAGLTLVDTPGADSINARHTGVAFNYIKNADAILFVTYYNHAFSQADREFLNQLGRVKDSFELDKMFFIVNAADLAASEAELQGVLKHVEDNLLAHGIRRPRLFPVSSVQALEGKLQADGAKLSASGIDAFERKFYPFIYEELNALVIEAAQRDIARASASLERWIGHAKRDEEQQLELLRQLKEAHARAVPLLDAAVTDRERASVRRETEELIYYIRHRIGIRFGEFFQLSFNPATLGANAVLPQALVEAWNELVRLISYDLSQEMLATTLRVEKHLKSMVREYRERTTAELRRELPDFACGDETDYRADTPAVEERLELARPDTRWLMQQFRNQKSFFEGGGGKKLREQLEQRVAEAVAQYAERHLERFAAHYADVYAEWRRQAASRLRETLDEFVEGSENAFAYRADLDDLARRLRALESIDIGA